MSNSWCLLVAVADAFEGGQVVEQAREINPDLLIIARAHSEAEAKHLRDHGASIVVMGEHEIANAMIDRLPAARPASGEQAKPDPTQSSQ